MKKINLKTVCDSALKTELEKRGYYVQYISKNINNLKDKNKIIKLEFDTDYWYLGETKDFSEIKFEEIIKNSLGIHPNYPIDIHKKYFKLNTQSLVTTNLIFCQKSDEGAIEFWRI